MQVMSDNKLRGMDALLREARGDLRLVQEAIRAAQAESHGAPPTLEQVKRCIRAEVSRAQAA
jgi:hypothetical protein